MRKMVKMMKMVQKLSNDMLLSVNIRSIVGDGERFG